MLVKDDLIRFSLSLFNYVIMHLLVIFNLRFNVHWILLPNALLFNDLYVFHIILHFLNPFQSEG